jgi:uncharacterized protein YkwD
VEVELVRKLGAALLALPILLFVYLAAAGRSLGRTRSAVLVGAVALVALGLVASVRPTPSAAVPPTIPHPVAASFLDPITTGHALTAPFTVGFDVPMDPASVAAALRMDPDPAVSFAWDAAGRTLTITPLGHWAPDTLYTLTIDTSARAADGGSLGNPVRAVVLTARAGVASVVAASSGGVVRPDTTFQVHLDRVVPVAAVQAAVRTSPRVAGTISGTGTDLVFTPAAPLAAGITYTVSLDGLVDADGVPFATVPALVVRTAVAPSVVRFRPTNGAKDVDPAAGLSVRFTASMNRAATAAAWTALVNGRKIAGKVAWIQNDTVMLFTPSAALPFGAKVVMTVGTGAVSRAGAPIAAAASVSFTVKAKPVPVRRVATTRTVTPPKTTSGATVAIPKSGGSGAVAGSWTAVESYYLRLMNCTRTGGWVTSSGSCSAVGGRNVGALTLNAGISTNVTRPYAKYLALHNLCGHFYSGSPTTRLRAAGYTSYTWAENIGCYPGSPNAAVLTDQLGFQAEKPSNGGHYVNMMNPAYNQAGIGVWVAGSQVRLVIDFYHP